MTIDDLRSRYIALFGSEPTPDGELERVEKRLGIRFQRDFAEIATFYCGGMLGGISFYDVEIGRADYNIASATERFRRTVELPLSFIVLAELGESFIVLNTNSKPGEPSVIWCDNEDVFRLETPEQLRKPDTWSSFSEFFQFLLDEEQRDRAEADDWRA